jgi:hypothetical protein
MKSTEDCEGQHLYIRAVYKWCNENYMILNVLKTNKINFCRENKIVHFCYFIEDVLIFPIAVKNAKVLY